MTDRDDNTHITKNRTKLQNTNKKIRVNAGVGHQK